MLDIRNSGDDVTLIEHLSRDTARHFGIGERVIVIDRTASLLDNRNLYERLTTTLAGVSILCVAVGRMPFVDGRPELRQPALLAPVCGILWVGDERGVTWSGGSGRPVDLGADSPSMLSRLLESITVPAVFDAVFSAIRAIPHQVACPGVDFVAPLLSDRDLPSLRLAALRELIAPTPDGGLQPLTIRPSRQGAYAPMPGSAIANVCEETCRDLQSAAEDIERLGEAGALIGVGMSSGRNSTLRDSLYGGIIRKINVLESALHVVDRQAAAGDASDELAAFGVPKAQSIDDRELAHALRTTLTQELRRGRSLPDIAIRLRNLANRQTPTGTHSERQRLTALRASLDGLRRSTDTTKAWLPRPALTLSIVLLSCLMTSWLAGTLFGCAVMAMWVGLAAIVSARRPAAKIWVAVDCVTIATIGLAAAVGVLVGVTVPVIRGVTEPIAIIVVILAAITAFATMLLAWRTATAEWINSLQLPTILEINGELDNQLHRMIAREAQPVRFRRRVADACLLLATGLTDIGDAIETTVAQEEWPLSPGTLSPPELVAVLRADLASLTVNALDPYLTNIGSGAELAVTPDWTARRFTSTYTQFASSFDSHAICRMPPMIDDPQPRWSLREVMWQSPDLLRRRLRPDGRGPLTQLCSVADLRLLNPAWPSARVIRFTPGLARTQIFGKFTDDITEIDADIAGIIRLTPVASGRSIWIHSARTDAGRAIGGEPL